ncbi:endonuclease/exonuclease/phosphatase family protein [Actinoplanes sp. RD1]|uniref:endonuclease/exonuclease/phosphatase family protein n=1 Tax=Actinoplanes sp. RD1 TaxID=3064538 RepID=UPI00274192FE|nr:endonuclease/exonuclease/phosphatase family protein [Actinoplanes sp. RD1]
MTGPATTDVLEPGAGTPAPAGPGRPRWCLATRILLAATLVWWLYLAAHLALSGRYWLWVLPDAVPPLVFTVAPLLLAAAAGGLRLVSRPLPRIPRRLVLGGALLALVAGVPESGLNPGALTGREPVPAGAIKVVSWNTQYWDQDDDPDRFYRYLLGLHADVYLLQEYLNWDPADPGDEARRVDDLARLRREFPGWHIVARGELITLSRFPIAAAPRVGPDRLPGADASFAAEYAAAKVLRTDLRIGGAVLSTYNVHIPVQFSVELRPELLADTRKRTTARAEQFAGLTGDVAANPGPVLVAGDFNTSPAMGDIRAVRRLLTDATPQLRSPYPVSWNLHGLPLWRLDWLFTGGGVRVHSYTITGSEGLSDHHAQQTWVSLG